MLVAKYHGAEAIAAVPKINEALSDYNIRIKRWDFSEPQAGKGPCDRAASVVKRHLKLYVAEGNQVTTPEEFVRAGSSHGGVKGTTFIYSTLNMASVTGELINTFHE